ncbi:MAG: glycoside hydrolase family 15 protein, partial [Thermomicrobia bacterium]|nr:glycoside hydrolase family 15 protein [Thermomicrobia bacterium]
MPRDLPIGNGSLLIGFDLSYEIRDIYYPNVGQENHTMGYPCRTGIWVDGQFAWFAEREWQRRMEYGKDTLVTEVTMYHPRLDVTLLCQDTVDFNRPLLIRRFHVTNHADRPRETRLFFHYDFHISGNGVGDTVYFDPITNALIFYKLLTIRTQTDEGGAIVAANDSDITNDSADTYSYVWPRDGALVSMALDSAGYSHLSRRFYEFCQRIIEKNGYFLHKYTPRGRLASSWHPWADATGRVQLPIQEDSTGLVLAGLWHHYRQVRDLEFIATMYRGLIKTAADFLLSYSDPHTGLPQPSHDLWEERYGVTAFGVSTVWAGLQAAANFTDLFNELDLSLTYRKAADEMKAGVLQYMLDPDRGRFVRMVAVNANGELCRDSTLDASQAALFVFGMFAPDDPAIVATMRAIEERLWVKTAVGGVARYANDYYHQVRRDVETVPGNPWFICTLWLAEWYIASARTM